MACRRAPSTTALRRAARRPMGGRIRASILLRGIDPGPDLAAEPRSRKRFNPLNPQSSDVSLRSSRSSRSSSASERPAPISIRLFDATCASKAPTSSTADTPRFANRRQRADRHDRRGAAGCARSRSSRHVTPQRAPRAGGVGRGRDVFLGDSSCWCRQRRDSPERRRPVDQRLRDALRIDTARSSSRIGSRRS